MKHFVESIVKKTGVLFQKMKLPEQTNYQIGKYGQVLS